MLPIRFGTVAPGDEEVLELLRSSYSQLLSEINRMQGKVEVGLKVFWKKEAVLQEVNSKIDKIKKIKEAGDEKKSYKAMLELGQVIQQVTEYWKEKYLPLIVKRLEVYSEESKLNDPFGVEMLFNLAFLVQESKRKEFEEELEKIAQKYQEMFIFRYVAPVSPYNFANLRINMNWERK